MKTARQWKLELWGYGEKKVKEIGAIQADALRHAADIVREAQSLNDALQQLKHQANQLDPKPKA